MNVTVFFLYNIILICYPDHFKVAVLLLCEKDEEGVCEDEVGLSAHGQKVLHVA